MGSVEGWLKDWKKLKGEFRVSYELGSHSQAMRWHGPLIEICAGASQPASR